VTGTKELRNSDIKTSFFLFIDIALTNKISITDLRNSRHKNIFFLLIGIALTNKISISNRVNMWDHT